MSAWHFSFSERKTSSAVINQSDELVDVAECVCVYQTQTTHSTLSVMNLYIRIYSIMRTQLSFTFIDLIDWVHCDWPNTTWSMNFIEWLCFEMHRSLSKSLFFKTCSFHIWNNHHYWLNFIANIKSADIDRHLEWSQNSPHFDKHLLIFIEWKQLMNDYGTSNLVIIVQSFT